MTGRFISFEGGEGSGKTTQVGKLQAYFEGKGVPCLLTREPAGEAVRQMLLTGAIDKWHPLSETLLFQAARVEHVERVIKPALTRGETVLCDRFLDSTLVYQGIAKGMGMDYVRALHHMTLGNFIPSLTLLLDIAPEAGLKRAHARAGNETRFEAMDMTFHHRVREGFLALAKAEPERFRVIDASRGVEEVHQAIVQSLA